jgi:hypothetical protein
MKSLTQLNTFSAASVAYDDQGTGAQTLADRYQINGLIDTAESVMSNIEKICSAAGSYLSYDIHLGKWGVIINTTGTSVASFDDTNILGSITISGTGINELYNSVKVEFPHRELRDSADFVTIEIADVDRNANEEDNTLNLTYDIINEPIQAQLLGLIELKQSRIDLAISFQTDYSNINVKAGDLIDVTNTRFGFTNKLFRVISCTEIQDDDGALKIEISALEYDANVYSTADLFRYTRTDENGIITIGSIGVPGTPQVTKFQIDARPRIIIETTVPTGVVEGIEYWITEDTLVAEANRSYRLIGTRRPSGGNTFTSGVSVTLEYDAITTGDFIVKTRGINAQTTGPFSTPSGLIEFVAQQTTDAIGPNTAVIDPTGALLTAVAANFIMGQIADVITGNASTSSFVYKIFEVFEDITGVDLIGEASGGTLVVASNLAVQEEGTSVTTQTQTINFIGDLVTATLVGNVVNVSIGGGGGIPSGGLIVNSVNPNVGPIGGGTVVTITGNNLNSATNVTFGGVTATSFTVVSDTSVTATTPSRTSTGSVSVNVITSTATNTANSLFTYIGGTDGDGSGGHIDITQTLPPDRTTYLDPLTGATSDTAPITGSYFARFSTAYGALTTGTGTAKLYKSDGTLVETLNAGSLTINNDVVGFPFASRDYGTDYYILLDTGLVEYCNKLSRAIVSPTIWNFNTPLYAPSTYTMTATTFTGPAAPTAISITPNTIDAPFTSSLSIQWSTAVTTGTGNVYVKDFNSDVTALTFTAAQLSLGNTSLGSLEAGKKYYVIADAGVVKNLGDCHILSQTNSAAIVKANNLTFTMISALQLITFIVDDDPVGSNKINPQTNIGLVFNRAIQLGTFGSFTVKTAAGATHQTFNVADTFGAQQVSEVLFTGSTGTYTNSIVWLNPTKDLTLGTTYYVNGDNGTVKDFFGQTWTGLSDTTTVRFNVDPGTTSTISSLTTASTAIELIFDRPIETSTGTLQILNPNGSVFATIYSTNTSIVTIIEEA